MIRYLRIRENKYGYREIEAWVVDDQLFLSSPKMAELPVEEKKESFGVYVMRIFFHLVGWFFLGVTVGWLLFCSAIACISL